MYDILGYGRRWWAAVGIVHIFFSLLCHARCGVIRQAVYCKGRAGGTGRSQETNGNSSQAFIFLVYFPLLSWLTQASSTAWWRQLRHELGRVS